MTSRANRFAITTIVIAASFLGAAGYLIAKNNRASVTVDPRSRPVVANIVSNQSAAIGAIGLVEPSSQLVNIDAEVQGTVSEVFVVAGQRIKRGDRLLLLDGSIAAAELLQREQDVAVAVSRLDLARAKADGLKAQVDICRNMVAAAQTELDDARDMFRIAEKLRGAASTSDRSITRLGNLARTAEAKLAETEARLRQSKAELALYDEAQGGIAIRVEAAAVEQARSAVAVARTLVQQRTIRAPMDATVLQVNIQSGEFAQPGVSAGPLMVLGSVDPLHVRVELDEADISHFSSALVAVGSARGNSGSNYRLAFVRIEPLVVPKQNLSVDMAQRIDTRVLQVVYAVLDSPTDLRAGQQLDIFMRQAPAPRSGDMPVSPTSVLPAPSS